MMEKDEIGKLFKKYREILMNFILKFVDNEADAEDILQEVWLSVIKHRDNYQDKGKFKSLLFKIARTKIIDMHRKRKKEKELTEDIPANEINFELKIDIENALKKLSFDEREIFYLKEISGLSFKEIAEIMGLPLGTVLSKMYRTLQKLRKILKDYEVR